MTEKKNYLTAEQEAWCDAHAEELLDLLKTLGVIPAPSHDEGRRAAFVKAWLENAGARDVRIDEAQNVIWPARDDGKGPVTVLMAHTDVVFPDTDPLPLREENGKLYAPGIGDDTANLVSLMMAGRYLIQHPELANGNLILVANSCEEGLGNLKGSRRIVQEYGSRMSALISIDGSMDAIVNDAVGSERYRIRIRAQGGHSYKCFGNTNAIVQMAEVIRALYEKVPVSGATYNAGVIEGGTTVNSICAECSLLYEYRSPNQEGMQDMRAFFEETIRRFREEGMSIEVETLGIRPCRQGVDEAALRKLTDDMKAIQQTYAGNEIREGAGSTDANSALGAGIPGVTIGAMRGRNAHTRDEWVEIDSLLPGLKITLAVCLDRMRG